MMRLEHSKRVVPLAWLLVGCNAILGIEERDLAPEAGGGSAAGTVGQSGSSSFAGSGDAGETGASAGRDGAGGSSTGGTAGAGFGAAPPQGEGGAGGDEAGGTSPFGGAGGSGGSGGAGGKGGSGGNAGTFSTGGGGSGGSAPVVDCSATIVSTSSGAGHTHTLTVPAADIAAGATKTYATSVTDGEEHFVQVTAANFTALKAGSEVKKKSCSGGDHQYVLKCGGGGTAPVIPTAQECPDECGLNQQTPCL